MTEEFADPQAVHVEAHRRLTRHHYISLIFGTLGIALIALVAPNISAEPRTFAFEPPPDPLSWTFNPRTMTIVIGIVYVLVGIAAFIPAVTSTWLVRSQMVAAALLIPLILGIAMALSDASQTNVTNLFDESLILATPIALGAMTGLWCERSGMSVV